MREIDEELREDLAELQETWDARAEEIETKSIPLEKSDIAVEEIVLLWVPARD